MSKDFTTSYAAIIKQEKQDDGTLMVYGKATDDSVDIDLQICDAAWLNRAMPEWFKTGGNIREQHSNIAAGVAKELDSTGDGHYISALVVDPVSVKKVETGVLKGFSIGIRAPRVVRDQKAANGRIIDGQIVEISLVDRPANPNAKLMLAKSVEGEATLVQVEELTEIKKHGDHDQSDHNPNGGGGSDKPEPESENPDRERPESGWNSSDQQTVNDAISANEDVTMGLNNLNDEDSDEFIEEGLSDDDENLVDDAMESLKEANEALESSYFAKTEEERARHLDNALVRMDEAASSLNNADSRAVSGYAKDVEDAMEEVEQLYDALDMDKSVKTTRQKERAMARKSRAEKSAEMVIEEKAAPSKDEMMKRLEDAKSAYMAAEKECKDAGFLDEDEDTEKAPKPVGETAEEETEEGSKPEAAEEEVEEAEGKKKIKAKKKSIDTVVPEPDTIEVGDTEKEDEEEDEIGFEAKTINAIIEKAVKSATESVRNEIDILKSANEADKEFISKLQGELASANQKAVNGGPKRSVIKQQSAVNEYATMALTYRQKAAATSDKTLALGYKELAKDFEAKAAAVAE